MPSVGLHKNRAVIGLSILLIPPLGLILLWMKEDSRLVTRMLGSLVAIAVGVLHLYVFWDLRMEMDGSMTHPIWKVLDDQQAYTSPHLVTLAGRLIVRNATEMACFRIVAQDR